MNCVLVLACLVVAATPQKPAVQTAAPPRTPPDSWSEGGWQTLRWGMGIDDVNERLQDKAGPFKATGRLECKASTVPCRLHHAKTAFRLLDRPVSLAFGFSDGRLETLRVEFAQEPRLTPLTPETTERLQRLLTQKYGKVAWEDVRHDVRERKKTLAWKTDALEVQLSEVRNDKGDVTSCVIDYADLGARLRRKYETIIEEEERDQAEATKL